MYDILLNIFVSYYLLHVYYYSHKLKLIITGSIRYFSLLMFYFEIYSRKSPHVIPPSFDSGDS